MSEEAQKAETACLRPYQLLRGLELEACGLSSSDATVPASWLSGA